MTSFQSTREAQDHASPPLVLDNPRRDCFRFLDLPAELRNLVYSFVVPDFQGELNIKHIQLSSNSLYPSRADLEWNNQKRCALGLTQICRKIRDEVLPLHVSSHTVAIHPKQLTRYTEHLLSGPADAMGTMALRIEHMDRYTRSVNILPLVELCTSAPRFKAMIGSSEISPLVWTTTLLRWVELRPAQLLLSYNSVDLIAYITMKEGNTEQCVDEDFRLELAYALSKDLRIWQNRVGLGGFSARAAVGGNRQYESLLR